MDSFEPTIGRWWSADHPTEAVPGYLDLDGSFAAGPFRLTVDGELAAPLEPGVDRNLTIHGETVRGRFTILRASPSSSSSHSSGLRAEVWHAWELVAGGHIRADDVFTYAQFRLPHLWYWIGPADLNYHLLHQPKPRPTPDEPGEAFTAQLPDGAELVLARAFTQSHGRASQSWQGYGTYVLQHEDGFTLERLDSITLALSRLHAVVAATPMRSFAVSVRRDLDARSEALNFVDAAPPTGDTWGASGHRDPFFDTAEVNFGEFVNSWIDLHSRATGAVAAAAPRDDHTFVTSKLVELCNGAEELAGLKWGAPDLSPEDQATLDDLKAAGLPARPRKLVCDSLRAHHWTLAQKLERLARLAGQESAEWLLGPSVSDWSGLIARLRNSIAHGSRLPGGLSNDVEFLIAAQLSVAAVLRLALLSVAGYENQLSTSSGELLWSSGTRAAGHPNSDLFNDFEAVSSYSAHWRTWLDRL